MSLLLRSFPQFVPFQFSVFHLITNNRSACPVSKHIYFCSWNSSSCLIFTEGNSKRPITPFAPTSASADGFPRIALIFSLSTRWNSGLGPIQPIALDRRALASFSTDPVTLFTHATSSVPSVIQPITASSFSTKVWCSYSNISVNYR